MLQAAVDWTDSHLHRFRTHTATYGIPAEEFTAPDFAFSADNVVERIRIDAEFAARVADQSSRVLSAQPFRRHDA